MFCKTPSSNTSDVRTPANPTPNLDQANDSGQPDKFDHHPFNPHAESSRRNNAIAATALPFGLESPKTEGVDSSQSEQETKVLSDGFFNLFIAPAFQNTMEENFQNILEECFQEISITNDLDTTLADMKNFFDQLSNKEPCFLFHLQILIKSFHQHYRLVPIEKAIDCIEHAMRCSGKPDNINGCKDIADSIVELLDAVWDDLTSNLQYEKKTKEFFDQLDEGRSKLPTPYCVEWITDAVKNIEEDFGLSKMVLVNKLFLIKIMSYRIHRVTAQPELLRNFQTSLPSASSHPVG